MNKKIVTNENYKELILKKAIICCWTLLLICFVIKIFGGNFFNIICHNQNFVDICNFIDNSIIKYVLFYIMYIATATLLIKICSPSLKIKSKLFLIYYIINSAFWCFKLLIDLKIIFINNTIIDIIDFIFLFTILSAFSKNIKMSIFTLILYFAFTIISVLTKNISNTIMTESYLITSIYMIDHYIMLFLAMLYSKEKYIKKEVL